jgi:tetratricopeptide (TPR) repeat protein
MKKIFFLLTLVITANIFAQTPAQQKKIDEAMKKAKQSMDKAKNDPEFQKAMEEYKKEMPNVQHRIDSLKNTKDGANIKNMNAPDIGKLTDFSTMPDVSKTIAESQQKKAALKTAIAAGNDKGLPKKSATAFTAKATSLKEINTWATSMLSNAKMKGGVLLEPMLRATYADTTINAASAGMLMIAAGMPKYTGHYLVCRYILDHPDNAMAINDLGIFMRLEKDLPKAISLFTYARSLNDTCIEIQTNLAWAYAYAGDFTKAKQNFNAVLKSRPDYQSANEGLALIAYQEGDKQALWNSLTKQIFSSNKSLGFSGSFPSAQMASFCGGVLNEDEINQMDKGGNSQASANNPYSNPNGADPEQQSEEKSIPSAPDISLNEYKPDLDNDFSPEDVIKSAKAIGKYEQEIKNEIAYVKSLLPSLPKPMQFVNSDGELETIYDYSKDAHYISFNQIHLRFEKLRAKVYGKYGDKLAAAVQSFAATYQGVSSAYIAALKPCANDDKCKTTEDCECIRKVKCEFIPRFKATILSFVMNIGDQVRTGMDEMADYAEQYKNDAAPRLQYISEPNWNKYLNAVKEADVIMAKNLMLMLYQRFIPACAGWVAQAQGLSVEGECVFEARSIPPDVSTPKLRKLKTLAAPCNDPAPGPLKFNGQQANQGGGPTQMGPLVVDDNCHHYRVGINMDFLNKGVKTGAVDGTVKLGAGAYFEQIRSKYVGEDNYKFGLTLTASVSVGINTEKNGSLGIIDLKRAGSAKAEAEINLDISRTYNSNGAPVSKSIAWNAKAGVSGSASINAALKDFSKINKDFFSAAFNHGVETSGELKSVMGPDGQLSNYNLESFHIGKTK